MFNGARESLNVIGVDPLKIIPYKAGNGFFAHLLIERKLTLNFGYVEDSPGDGRIWIPGDPIRLEAGFEVDLVSILHELAPEVREYQLRQRSRARQKKPRPTLMAQLPFDGIDEVA